LRQLLGVTDQAHQIGVHLLMRAFLAQLERVARPRTERCSTTCESSD
jgi:hypothetical protein